MAEPTEKPHELSERCDAVAFEACSYRCTRRPACLGRDFFCKTSALMLAFVRSEIARAAEEAYREGKQETRAELEKAQTQVKKLKAGIRRRQEKVEAQKAHIEKFIQGRVEGKR